VDITVCVRPGRRLDPAAGAALVEELRAVADVCFDGQAPRYQVLRGAPADLDRAVLALARERTGRLVGFSACLLLPVDGVGEVFHLGLTCVRPDARSGGLTHRLLSAAATRYLVWHRPLRGVWVSNVACVLSSLGNVALHFEDVYPSPFHAGPPSAAQRAIARAIAAHHRDAVAIDPAAVLDEDAFVLRGSVPGTCFEKRATDARYHHRDLGLTRWYAERMDFVAGDEVVQVGRMSIPGALRYGLARALGRRPVAVPAPRPALSGALARPPA
jgi:GNAT superfamily N-acetyltransferase